jgi:soluble lytic murein transglycosylase-like protein
MRSVARVALAVMGTATAPLPLGTTPLGASSEPHEVAAPTSDATLDEIARRIDAVDAELREFRRVATHEIAPLVNVLTDRYEAPGPVARQIAVALVREGRRTQIDAGLLLAVLLVENPWIDTEARSFMGAVGLMQVMPFHAGAWGCSASDLTDIDANICHGASILAHAILLSAGDLDRALLRYNGCVMGTNTPDCHRYPSWVHSRLAHLRGEEPTHAPGSSESS